MRKKSNLYIVHCIDTEGPLNETIDATFDRLKDLFKISIEASPDNLFKLQNGYINLNGIEEEVSKILNPRFLNYNKNWFDIEKMLSKVTSLNFRNQYLDSIGGGWVFSWHCVDHLGLLENPRDKDYGYGKIFRRYRNYLNKFRCVNDEINWHFHPLSLKHNPLAPATSYHNSLNLFNNILCKRIIEDNWFPTTNRPGFHSIRQDSNLLLEQWIPFDYSNQAMFNESITKQSDLIGGRFGDWRRAPKNWIGYNPDIHDYQIPGECKRWIFKCLNIGTRARCIDEEEIENAFLDSRNIGSAILAIASHDYRDLALDVQEFLVMLSKIKIKYPDVNIIFSGAESAAKKHINFLNPKLKEFMPPKIKILFDGNVAHVKLVQGVIMGSQPFLSIRTLDGEYFHDNFDEVSPGKSWQYIFDDNTLPFNSISRVGVGCAGRYGGFSVSNVTLV
jgi:hypothetical protein